MFVLPVNPFIEAFATKLTHQSGLVVEGIITDSHSEHSLGKIGLTAKQYTLETGAEYWNESIKSGDTLTDEQGESYLISHIYPEGNGWVKANLRSA